MGVDAGCRLPGEAGEACARRELLEETGLDMSPMQALDDEQWPLYLVEAPPGVEIRLSAEHDAYRWADLAAATALIKPEHVAAQVGRVAELLSSSARHVRRPTEHRP